MTITKAGHCGSGERAATGISARPSRRPPHLLLPIALALALAAAASDSARAAAASHDITASPQIISSDVNAATGYYTILNLTLGATRFWAAGYFGNNAMIANVEAGYVWNGHETLSAVNSYVSNAPINQTTPQYDYHATMVGFEMVGLGPPVNGSYYYYQTGMAPYANLTSVAIATDWVGTTGQFDISSSTLVYGYKTVMQDGVSRQIAPGITVTRPVDVVNSSWGYDDPNSTQQPTLILDALTAANHQTVCIAAGNSGSGGPNVGGPASGFNVIAVGALGDDTTQPPYQNLASFSSTGPNNFYNPATGQTIPGVRAAVSIVAPGSNLTLPAYTGATGTNSDGSLFDTTGFPPSDLNKLYFTQAAGTSFASPLVAGGASLVVDAGYSRFGGGHAVDGRVIKAVLLNSADKTPGWTNNTTLVNGVLTTTQGLDFNTGAGALNLNKAYDQYLSGTAGLNLNGGSIHPLGWAFGHVAASTPNDYLLDTPLHAGDTFTATLTWFVNTYFNTSATADPTADNFSDADLHQTYFDQLDLQVWQVANGQLSTLIADSTSPYNNTDHLYFTIPSDGNYALRISYLGTTYDLFGTSPHADDYGLAWSDVAVPEPASLPLLLGGFAFLIRRRRTAL
ncbi:MAG TPA: S8 family serine peptidase [Phycisphaerae bacterium]|nr:S8 family serine peptidase [Phycisphaerae bacterium]